MTLFVCRVRDVVPFEFNEEKRGHVRGLTDGPSLTTRLYQRAAEIGSTRGGVANLLREAAMEIERLANTQTDAKLQNIADSVLRKIALQYGSTTKRDFRVIEIVFSEMVGSERNLHR